MLNATLKFFVYFDVESLKWMIHNFSFIVLTTIVEKIKKSVVVSQNLQQNTESFKSNLIHRQFYLIAPLLFNFNINTQNFFLLFIDR